MKDLAFKFFDEMRDGQIHIDLISLHYGKENCN
jgi:hypothetical protein